jgi:hypothetical protein
MSEVIFHYVVCGKCHKKSTNVPFEINFFTKEIYYLCPFCNDNNVMSLRKEAVPLPRIKTLKTF